LGTRNVNINRYEDEYALFGKALPYIAMLIGSGLVFLLAVVTRLGIYSQDRWNHTPPDDSTKMVVWIIIISCVLLSALGWKLFRPRDQFHHYVSVHVLITSILVHAWLLMAVLQNQGEWMFGMPTVYAYFYGGAVLGLSWCIRRWSFRGEINGEEMTNNSSDIWEVIGLGKAQGPERTLGSRFIRQTTTKAKSGISSLWIWIIVRLSKTPRRNSPR